MEKFVSGSPILRKGCFWRVGNRASICVFKDCWPGYFSKKGRYTVWSGYFVAKQLRKEEINAGESSEQRAYGSLWPQLWKVDVPNEINFFFL